MIETKTVSVLKCNDCHTVLCQHGGSEVWFRTELMQARAFAMEWAKVGGRHLCKECRGPYVNKAIEERPDPVAEFKASVAGPFEARCAFGACYSIAPTTDGYAVSFPARDVVQVPLLCAILNAATGEAKDA